MVAHKAALYSGQSLKHGAARGTVLIKASPVKRLRTSHMIREGQLASPGNTLHWLVDFNCIVALVGKLKSEALVRFRAVRLARTGCVSWRVSHVKYCFPVNVGTTAAAGATLFFVASVS